MCCAPAIEAALIYINVTKEGLTGCVEDLWTEYASQWFTLEFLDEQVSSWKAAAKTDLPAEHSSQMWMLWNIDSWPVPKARHQKMKNLWPDLFWGKPAVAVIFAEFKRRWVFGTQRNKILILLLNLGFSFERKWCILLGFDFPCYKHCSII